MIMGVCPMITYMDSGNGFALVGNGGHRPALRTSPRATPKITAEVEPPPPPVEVATDAAWAGTLRRFARLAIWTLPGYGAALAAAGFLHQDGLAAPIVVAVAAWLAPVAMMALAALLAGVPGRTVALTGLLAGLAGAGATLAATGTPGYQRLFELIGGGLTTLGWAMFAIAVLASRLAGRADGVLFLIAAPLAGIGAAYNGRVGSIGGVLLVAAGLGLAWTSARLLPEATRRPARVSGAARRSGERRRAGTGPRKAR